MTIHTVKRGDTVSSIAREYGVPPSRIITDNFLSEPGRLVVGQDLTVSFPTLTYTVLGGDTLFSISERFNVPINTLYRNNPFLNGIPEIVPGQILTIIGEDPVFDSAASLNGYVYPFVDRTVLRRTLPFLTYLSIFTYGIREDGTLIAPEGSDDELIEIASEYGTVPLLMLTSLTEAGTFSNALVSKILSDKELADRVTDSVVSILQEKRYGGIDVDFEYIGASQRNAYIEFLTLLSEKLEGRFLLFVSLAPKVDRDQPGILYEGHDYDAIGQIADKTLIMTYEWGYTYGPPNAVSPLPEVKKVLDYAVSAIPRDKILTGIPNYGYDWPLPFERGITKARTLGNVEAVDLAGDKQAQIEYDGMKQAPYFNYYDRPSTYDDAVQHVVWFENARSSSALLNLISEYGIYGAGIWNLMKYFPALWTVANSKYTLRKTAE